MFKFTVKRILLMIPSVIVITLLTFLIMANSSGSPGAIALGIKAKPETSLPITTRLAMTAR